MKPPFKISVIVILLSGTTIYLPSCMKEATPPIVITTMVSDITNTTASTGGSVNFSSDAEVTARGVCWGISHNPTIDFAKTYRWHRVRHFYECYCRSDAKYYLLCSCVCDK